ncbi:MAG: enoyl-CoA hydratase/isomerase family protein, partial [Deltaproteobacteria bacterium]|nr:enoyl-CoA hydratase/isomerase family protein [Deltaproteobacteria bacterium]
MSADLLYEVKDRTAFLIINREDRRNAISQEMIAGLLAALDQAEQDETVRAVCLTAQGERAFCSGADLGLTLAREGGDRLAGARNYAVLLKKMARFGKPTVARVNGACLAGGLGLMLSCDIAIARQDASFWTPEVNVGIFPMMVGALLIRQVGWKKMMDMVLTGRKVSAPEAERIGLISRAVAPERLDEEIREVLKGLTSKSPIGLRLGKEAFRTMADLPFEDALDYLCEALGRAVATEDAREGMTAFIEKREP